MKDLRVLWYCGLPGLSGGSMIDIDFESFEDDPDRQTTPTTRHVEGQRA